MLMRNAEMPQIRSSAWLVLPVLLLVVLYWPGLTTWFYQDDFGWLNLRHDVHSARDLAGVLLAPKAHGNMRPLGENAYWLRSEEHTSELQSLRHLVCRLLL